jgi:hypothetical protein
MTPSTLSADCADPTASQSDASNHAIAHLTAQVVVLCKLVDAALSHLSPTQCHGVTQAFRGGIEDALATMDDVVFPDGYRESLLGLTNAYLNELQRRGQRFG